MNLPDSSYSDPATKVIERLERFDAYQQQSKTQDELSAITKRIQHTLEDYEKSSNATSPLAGSSCMKMVDELKQMDIIVKDKLLKNEYQQNLSLLVGGYKQLCSQRMEILSQISEFFSLYSSEVDGDVSNSDDYLESLNVSIHDTMSGMETLLLHLSGTSRNVIDFMEHLHCLSKSKSNKHRKKMEKTIQHNKTEISKITEKMQKLHKDLLAREDKIVLLNKNVDEKRTEAELLKRQADAAKRNFQALENDWKSERETLVEQIEGMKKEIAGLERGSGSGRKIDERLKDIRDIALKELHSLKERIGTGSLQVHEIHEEIAEHFSVQLQQMREAHEDEVTEWRAECVEHVRRILEIEVTEEDSLKLTQSPYKEKPISPYHTSSAFSIAKPPSEENEPTADGHLMSLGDVVRDDSSTDELTLLKCRLHSMDAMQEQMSNEVMKLQNEKVHMLAQIEQLKQLQEATESDALEALNTLENLTSDRSDVPPDLSTTRALQTSESNKVPEHDVSTSSLSKLSSPSTNTSLVGAYRQKIADRREAISQQQSENRVTVETPRAKGLLDANLLEEHLQIYRAVMNFKQKVIELLSKEAGHEAHAEAIREVSTIDFDTTNDQVQVHLARMSTSVEAVLASIHKHLRFIVSAQPSAPVEVTNLQRQLSALRDELVQTRGAYERRTQHDAAMIMHMQNTLSETQRGNTTAAGTSGSGFPSSPAVPAPSNKTPGGIHLQAEAKEAEATIMFSRQDAQHNEIVLKKAAVAGKISEETLTSVTTAMTAYSSISRNRIQQLASKLVHHNTMKKIETNVRGSNFLTSEVFCILEKMESLQQRRAQQWARGMDDMTSERKRLGHLLCDAFERLERYSGVFLIKPLVSFQGKGPMTKYAGKISTKFNKHQIEAMLRKMLGRKVEPTALSAIKDQGGHRLDAVMMRALPTLSNQTLNVAGLRAPRSSGSVNVWRVDASLPRNFEKKSQTDSPLHFPRLMELDIARSRDGRETTPRRNTGRALSKEGGQSFLRADFAYDSHSKPSSSIQLASAPKESRSPDYKSGVPPTTPASPQMIITPSQFSDDSIGGPIRSNLTPPSYIISSKSAPEMSRLLAMSPMNAKKDMATSPLVE